MRVAKHFASANPPKLALDPDGIDRTTRQGTQFHLTGLNMTLDALCTDVRETVDNFRQHLSAETEKTNKRVDQMEAIVKRASLSGNDTAEVKTDEGSVSVPIFRKQHSLVARKHGSDGVKRSRDICLSRILKGIALGNWRGAEAEEELMRKSAAGFSTGPGGGFLLPELVDDLILDLARPASVVQRLGGGFLNVEGFTKLPQLNGDVTGSWRQENQEIVESSVSFGAINIQPKSIGFLIRTSLELLEDAGPSVEAFFRSTIAGAYASALDHVALAGEGMAEPVGIINSEGVNTEAIGGTVDWDDIVDAAADVFQANFAGEYRDLGIALNPRTAASLSKLKGTANDHYLQAPEPVREMMRVQSTHIPIETSNTSAIIGDFRQVAIAQRVGLTIMATMVEGEAFRKNQLLIRGVARLDVAVFRPKWFTVLTGITN